MDNPNSLKIWSSVKTASQQPQCYSACQIQTLFSFSKEFFLVLFDWFIDKKVGPICARFSAGGSPPVWKGVKWLSTHLIVCGHSEHRNQRKNLVRSWESELRCGLTQGGLPECWHSNRAEVDTGEGPAKRWTCALFFFFFQISCVFCQNGFSLEGKRTSWANKGAYQRRGCAATQARVFTWGEGWWQGLVLCTTMTI